VSGTAAASRLITGKDIKNHSIGVVDLNNHVVNDLRGAQGDRGARGKTGRRGPRGVSVIGQQWSGAHVSGLQTAGSSVRYAAVTGVRTASAGSPAGVAILSPGVPITLRSLSVSVSALPATGERDFAFSVNGSEVGALCLVFASSSVCSVDEAVRVPALSTLALKSVVVGSGAAVADADVAWSSTAAH
jgi:hypothetical protein